MPILAMSLGMYGREIHSNVSGKEVMLLLALIGQHHQ